MMITEIEDFFIKGCGRCARFNTPDCSTQKWAAGLSELRKICTETGLTETVKWGHPCYVHAARNIAIYGAFRDNFRLTFFNAALLKDPDGILEKQGPNTRHADMIRFTGNDQVAAMKPLILSYLREAMEYADAGTKPPRDETKPGLPDELVNAMDCDAEMAVAFSALTPGRQRSYVIALSSTKIPATRIARIAKLRDRIIAGKGANE